MISLPRSLSPNERAVVDHLLARGPLSKTELADAVQMSKPSMRELIARLQASGVVEAAGETDSSKPGPNAQRYAACVSLARMVGVAIEPRSARAFLVDLGGRTLAEAEFEAPVPMPPVDLVACVVRDVCGQVKMVSGELDLIVVATPGIVDSDGDIDFVYGHPEWRHGQRSALRAALDCDVLIENDMNLSIVAEHRLGAGRGAASLALVRSEGSGAAFLLNGGLVRGAHGYAGELGLIPVDADPPTPIEAPVSRSRDELAGNPELLAGAIAQCVRMCLTICAVLDPERILLTGPLADSGGRGLLDAVSERITAASAMRTDVGLADLDERSAVTGAILIGLDRMRDRLYGTGAVLAPDHFEPTGSWVSAGKRRPSHTSDHR